MVSGFWEKLKKPIMALAPMADVTDAAFRRLIAKYGKPDIMWTEFVACDGLCSEGRGALLRDLWFTEEERPIVAQFFGGNPDNFYKCAELAQELGFDGIDINMGCPDRGVEKSGGGAILIKNPELAKKIISETKRGAGPLPVSVKTRLGYHWDELESWLPNLLEAEPVAVTIHARTRDEMSDVPARWERVARAVELRDKFSSSGGRTLILGNGDVDSLERARSLCADTGADGAMIGRGIFGAPWFFNQGPEAGHMPLGKKLEIMIEHTKLFEEVFGGKKNFDIMKKHYKAYAGGFDGAKELRIKLMEAKNSTEVESITREFIAGL